MNHTWDRKCFDGLWNLGDLDIVKKAIVRFELFVMKSTNNQNTIWSCKIATSSASQQCLNAQKRMPAQRDWTMNWNFAKHGWQSIVTERKRIGFIGIRPYFLKHPPSPTTGNLRYYGGLHIFFIVLNLIPTKTNSLGIIEGD